MRRYADHDLTGQQLINSGLVLINGERVGLELQSAEAELAETQRALGRVTLENELRGKALRDWT